jgi:hypothetical protein
MSSGVAARAVAATFELDESDVPFEEDVIKVKKKKRKMAMTRIFTCLFLLLLTWFSFRIVLF